MVDRNSEYLRNLKHLVDSKLIPSFTEKDLEKYEQAFVENIVKIQMVRMENENIMDEMRKYLAESDKLDSMLENKAMQISRIDDKLLKK